MFTASKIPKNSAQAFPVRAKAGIKEKHAVQAAFHLPCQYKQLHTMNSRPLSTRHSPTLEAGKWQRYATSFALKSVAQTAPQSHYLQTEFLQPALVQMKAGAVQGSGAAML